MRQMIKLSKLKRTYRKSATKRGYYECEIDTDNDKKILWTFKLDEEFENEYLEGKNHTVRLHRIPVVSREVTFRSLRKDNIMDLASAAGFRLKSRTTGR